MASLSADQTRFWSISHAKNLHFGGAHVLQILDKLGAVVLPMNCALYADAVEYSPVAESFHLIVSGLSLCSTVGCTSSQSCRNSMRCVKLMAGAFRSSRIQLLLCRASATVRCFLLVALYKLGAMSFGRRPCSQPDC